MPKVSVIIPAYNAERFVRNAVASVANQSERDIEIIVIDDCSSDGTADICRAMAESDGRIRFMQNERNSGVSATRNSGVAAATGEYVAFLDSDDMWKPDKLALQLALANKHPECPIFFTASSFISSDGAPYTYTLHVPETVDFKRLLRQNIISCSSVMARREILLAHPFMYDGMHEDYAVWLEILRAGTPARGIDDALLIYRLSDGSKSSNKLHSAVMQYRVYRHIGLGVLRSLFYMPIYTLNGMKKYKGIKDSRANNMEISK